MYASLWIEQEYWNIGQVQKWSINFPSAYHSSRSWIPICSNLPKIKLTRAAWQYRLTVNDLHPSVEIEKSGSSFFGRANCTEYLTRHSRDLVNCNKLRSNFQTWNLDEGKPLQLYFF